MALNREAEILSPIFHIWSNLTNEKVLPEYDFGGLYILAYLALRRPRKWSSGKFKIPIALSVTSDEGEGEGEGEGKGKEEKKEKYFSTKLINIPHIIELLTVEYLEKIFGANSLDEITVVTIFATVRLTGIKKNIDDFINHSIVNWALHQRPFRLLMEIPSPLQVLRMQANGTRVATSFLSIEELSSQHIAKLTYMEGHQNHSKDAFEFFIHDLKHMENFIDSNTFHEQVGFFSSFLTMSGCETVSPKKYLRTILQNQTKRLLSHLNLIESCPQIDALVSQRFQQLWNELEYLISDMNCYLPHLMKYFVAKLTINCQLLFQDICKVGFSLLTTTSSTTHSSPPPLPPPLPLVFPSFGCFLRNIWIEIIQSLHISCTTTEEDDIPQTHTPFESCMSLMNHSLTHSPTQLHFDNLSIEKEREGETEKEEREKSTAQYFNFVCVCSECCRYEIYNLSIRDEGEILRTHFRELGIQTLTIRRY